MNQKNKMNYDAAAGNKHEDIPYKKQLGIPLNPKIVAAAILLDDSGDLRLWTGLHHCDIIPTVIKQTKQQVRGEELGFVLQNGKFVNRSQALEIAKKSKQIPKNTEYFISEYLW